MYIKKCKPSTSLHSNARILSHPIDKAKSKVLKYIVVILIHMKIKPLLKKNKLIYEFKKRVLFLLSDIRQELAEIKKER